MKKSLVIVAVALAAVVMTGCSTVEAKPEPSQIAPKSESTRTLDPAYMAPSPNDVTPGPVSTPPSSAPVAPVQGATAPLDHAVAPPHSSYDNPTIVQVMQPSAFLQIEMHFTPAQYERLVKRVGPCEGPVGVETANKISPAAAQIGIDHEMFGKPVNSTAPKAMWVVIVDR